MVFITLLVVLWLLFLGTNTSLFCRGNMALRRFDSILKETLDSEVRNSSREDSQGGERES